jgi:hypothetical protein
MQWQVYLTDGKGKDDLGSVQPVLVGQLSLVLWVVFVAALITSGMHR